jgi:hypothetical protein
MYDSEEADNRTMRHGKNWQRSFGVVSLACLTLALAMVVGRSLVGGKQSRPTELVVGGGFLGDLPTGGEHGNDKVRAMKELVHSAANQRQLQDALSSQMGMSQSVSDKKAEAIAAAAAAIAKILNVPSARSIVLGHAAVHHSSADASPTNQDSSEQSSSSSSSSKDVGQKLTPWLKTPKEEGRFTYHNKKLANTFSMCSKRTDYECNEVDTASQVSRWQEPCTSVHMKNDVFTTTLESRAAKKQNMFRLCKVLRSKRIVMTPRVPSWRLLCFVF